MIGVSRRRVKPTGPEALLPPAHRWTVQQPAGRVSRGALARLDHVILVTPDRIPESALRSVPGLRPLQALHRRLGKEGAGRPLRGRVAEGTALTLGTLPPPGKSAGKQPKANAIPAAFPLLRFAGDIVADALADQPRALGILLSGFAADDEARVATALLLALGARTFTPPAFRKETTPAALKTVRFFGLGSRLDLARTLAEIDGMNLVRWLTALPANKLSAGAYQTVLRKLAAQHGWDFQWLGAAELRKLNAGAFLAVAQGNATTDAGIARLRYRPRRSGPERSAPDVALVGKGIIFDTGGTNLKTAPHMLDMHTDMAGSAVALGVLQALTALRSPLAVDCWLAITENRTGPTAYKQRDVVTASNGTTIEIIHTDAEGRMVLADTLALAGREQPRLMVDYATLTGACMYALSERYSGVFTNRDTLNDLLVRAGRDSGERVWPFPNDPDFDDDLKSKLADVAQCASGGEADHILAARFLQRFVPEGTPWVHVDLASALRKDGLGHVPGGPTGFGVRYSLALLLDHAAELQQLVA